MSSPVAGVAFPKEIIQEILAHAFDDKAIFETLIEVDESTLPIPAGNYSVSSQWHSVARTLKWKILVLRPRKGHTAHIQRLFKLLQKCPELAELVRGLHIGLGCGSCLKRTAQKFSRLKVLSVDIRGVVAANDQLEETFGLSNLRPSALVVHDDDFRPYPTELVQSGPARQRHYGRFYGLVGALHRALKDWELVEIYLPYTGRTAVRCSPPYLEFAGLRRLVLPVSEDATDEGLSLVLPEGCVLQNGLGAV
ncbi:hypothetical protein MKEN_00685400 [Mycena kentingensis (nom. inval.)]|nr:hypothetical protein MKEN_00685400 [Mycena kentingensis (nom. inval.)]